MSAPQVAAATMRRLKSDSWKGQEAADRFVSRTDSANEPAIEVANLLNGRFQQLCRPGWKVLDLGCGPGSTSRALADWGCNVVACDISKELLRALRDSMGDRAIETRVGDAFNIPATDEEFDGVVARMLLGHFPDWHLVVREMVRVCKPGGTIAFHFCSKEHRDLAGAWREKKPCELIADVPTNSPALYASAASVEEMRGVCKGLNVELIAVEASEFFNYNYWIGHALGTEGFNRYREEYQELMRSPGARDFVLWFEKTVVPYLPPFFCFANLTVIRKPL